MCPDGLKITPVPSDDPGLARFVVEEMVHRCPSGDSGIMPCCGRTPFEVSPRDRITLDDALVTCGQPPTKSVASGGPEGADHGR